MYEYIVLVYYILYDNNWVQLYVVDAYNVHRTIYTRSKPPESSVKWRVPMMGLDIKLG